MSVCSAMASKGGAHIIELALLYMLYNEPAALAVNQEKLAVKAKHTLTCLFETVLSKWAGQWMSLWWTGRTLVTSFYRIVLINIQISKTIIARYREY